MKVNIILFGQLTDIAGAESFVIEDSIDTDSLVIALQKKYPALINAKYLIAVDKKVIQTNTLLPDNCTVALLPPFSGG
jgi:sulfur-carrier protein